MLKGLIDGDSFSLAINSAIHNLYSSAFITSLVSVFVAFLFFNAFWVIRTKVGPTALYDMFFKRKANN